jgi:hypothetical protein
MTFKSALPVLVLLSLLSFTACPVYAEDSSVETTTTDPEKKMAPKKEEAVRTMEKRVAQDDLMREKSASRTGEVRPADKMASTAANLRDKVASRGALLREKLATFKDKRKVTIIERISTSLTNINQRRTSAMMQHVDVLMGILSKAESRLLEAETSGIDVAAVKTELGLGKTALANAKTAVEEQSKKTYEIKISTESAAKAETKQTRDLLEQDLKATHGLLKESRRIMINALTKMSQLMGGGTQTNESE